MWKPTKQNTPPDDSPTSPPKAPSKIRSKYAKKRNVTQIAADEKLIERLALEGYGVMEITAHIKKIRPYSLDCSAISDTLKKIRLRWKEETTLSIEEHVQRELKGLDRQEKELWKAWRRSQEDAESETVTHTADGKSVQRKREGQVGAVQFQNALFEIRAQRRALLGLDKPKKTALTNVEGTEDVQPLIIAVSPEELPKPRKK